MGIGTDTMNAINKAAQELNGCVQEKFEPYEGVYRINDGDYVSEKNWKKVWNQYPSWWSDAWMLAGNGTYSETDVTDMSIEEILSIRKPPTLNQNMRGTLPQGERRRASGAALQQWTTEPGFRLRQFQQVHACRQHHGGQDGQGF